MVFRLFMYLVAFGFALLVPGGGIAYLGYRAFKPRIEAWKRRRLAKKHARELAAHEAERCFYCLEPCSEQDCYEDGKGWYHPKCLKALLG